MEGGKIAGEKAIELLVSYGPKLVMAIVVLLIGMWAIKIATRAINRAMERGKMEPSLRKFLNNVIGVLLKILLIISVASMAGIATTSFVAILGAAGLAVGLALQGSLANFAGGVLLLLFKPFKIGDVVEAQGYTGKVHEIQIFNTILKTPDNKTIFIPNGPLAGGTLTNYSTESQRRVDMTFGIGYEDDMARAKKILRRLIAEDERILPQPAPVVVVTELGDSSVNIAVRVWCNATDYWNIYFDMQEKVKLTFDQEGISIPFPQQDVHVFQNTE